MMKEVVVEIKDVVVNVKARGRARDEGERSIMFTPPHMGVSG